MNTERRSSRKKRDTLKVKEAKDELLKKQTKRTSNDKSSPSSKQDKKKSQYSNLDIDDEFDATTSNVSVIEDAADPSVMVEDISVVDDESSKSTSLIESDVNTKSFSSAFIRHALEELFKFLYDNKKSLIGHGDLKPENIDDYMEDQVKEMNSEFLGQKISVSRNRSYYEAMIIDGVQYRIFDNVFLLFSSKSQNTLPNVARIIAFYEENSRKLVTLEWYYRPSDMLPTMERIRITGRHPLIPVSDDSYEINPNNSNKKKRGRPPNKRLFNVEETIKTLEETPEYEVFTSIKPYIDDLSVSVIGEKCNVIHLQPNATIPKQDKSIKTLFYKKTLEFKICALTFCKPRSNKPRQWIELLEKKNRDIKSHYASRKVSDIQSFTTPKRNGNELKKKKRKVDTHSNDDIVFDDREEEDIIDDDVNLFDYPEETDVLTSIAYNNELIENVQTSPTPQFLQCPQNLGQKMEMIGNTISKKLEQIERMIEVMNTDVQMSLEELKTSILESKKETMSNFQVAETSVLPDEFIHLSGPSFQDSVFINQQFL